MKKKKPRDTEIAEDGKLFLREEDLDIEKYRTRAGEVNLHKDIIEERKTVDVPLSHEEVIIERKALNHRMSDTPVGDKETIRIPVSEEHVNVGKHTELRGEVGVKKHDVQETKHIDEKLKRDEAHVDVDGNPRIIKKKDDYRH
jgi:uncharacterized protein (TIGR02271 family)